MAEHALGVEVVTPESSSLFRGPATALVASTSEGDLTIMAEHAELIGDVVPGVVKIEQVDGTILDVIVHGGFLQVTSGPGAAIGLIEGVSETERTTRVTVLAGEAELLTEVDLAVVETEIVEIEARLEGLRGALQAMGPEDEGLRDAEFNVEQAQGDLDRAELRKRAASEKRS